MNSAQRHKARESAARRLNKLLQADNFKMHGDLIRAEAEIARLVRILGNATDVVSRLEYLVAQTELYKNLLKRLEFSYRPAYDYKGLPLCHWCGVPYGQKHREGPAPEKGRYYHHAGCEVFTADGQVR